MAGASNPVLERARQHYQDIGWRYFPVPEWGSPDNPLVVQFTKLTVNQRRRIYRPLDNGDQPAGATVMLRAVIAKACGPDGKPLFDEMDEHALGNEVDGDVIGAIGNAILYGVGLVDKTGKPLDAKAQLDAEKNA